MSNNQIFSLGYSQKKKKLKFLILEQKLQLKCLTQVQNNKKSQVGKYPFFAFLDISRALILN